jgi:hypothetical protein
MATQTRSNKKKKKINPNGIVHIKATLITQILQFQMNLVMLLLGQRLERQALRVLEKTLLMQQLLLQRKSQVK